LGIDGFGYKTVYAFVNTGYYGCTFLKAYGWHLFRQSFSWAGQIKTPRY